MSYIDWATDALSQAEQMKRNSPDRWDEDVDFLAEAARLVADAEDDCDLDNLLTVTRKLYKQRPRSNLDIDVQP